ncbi:ribonucleoside-diphosphate reductase, adenosylcobalamin-dependent [Candidatus Woesearchaeota archaeon RBG_13_36_6]|nr:MAG: ribonucleoside-diphosphate reductase, adenosylcobalamin-dependent [Candidatus Woesearchaeota archaeon RBG_13_36_6]
MIKKIRKRNGKVVAFDKEKIVTAIFKASDAVGTPDTKLANKLSEEVVKLLEDKSKPGESPTVEQIQDLVEDVLMKSGQSKIAKSYILYRQERVKLREQKALLGVKDDFKLSLNAVKVLKNKFLRKDENNTIIESTSEMFMRVANNIAQADKKYKGNIAKAKQEFYEAMTRLEFLPNAPTLRSAGRRTQQLSACFVLPIEDSIVSIFDAVKHTAILCQKGGGVGFNFGKLRPHGDIAKKTVNIASGPISFMKIFDTVAKEISHKGWRSYGMMAILPVSHPQIMEFIKSKDDGISLKSFNISVGITDSFMKALEHNKEYNLINPHNNEVVEKVKAKKVFDAIAEHAWITGEPGIVFLDRLDRDNPTPNVGKIESTNVCGEQPLLPYESCNLGSINLAKMLKYKDSWTIDWDKLRRTVHIAVHFLDNIIDMNEYPLPEIEKMTKGNRKIGLGVMGFADMLLKLDTPYNSKEALELAEKVLKFILEEGRKASVELAKQRGSFPNFKGSVWDKKGYKYMRNATITTIAPTGTISMIGDCNGGIEPIFALAYTNKTYTRSDGVPELEIIVINKLFEQELRKRDLYSGELMKEVAQKGSIQNLNLPKDLKSVFVTAHDISPEWHVKIQAAFQEYTDNAVSKTVNFPNNATVEDVKKVYMLAYKLGSKGITIYRDKSRQVQVLNIESAKTNPDSGKCATCD